MSAGARTLSRPELRRLLLGAKACSLFGARGRVVPARQFALDPGNLKLLSPTEAELVRSEAASLADAPLAELPRPVVLADAPPGEGEAWPLPFQVDGARSAYLPTARLQLKACRPLPGAGASFISEELDPVSGRLRVSTIPFGVLEPEGVMRELLAYCFARRHRLAVVREPVAVMRYEGGHHGHAVVFRCDPLSRTEQSLVYPDLTLEQLLASAACDEVAGTALQPGEVPVRGLPPGRYPALKAAAMVRWHWAGGFRGVLNSNIGNEVLLGEPAGDVALFDFDSFCVRPPPADYEPRAAAELLLRMSLEAIRACPPLAVFVPEASTPEDTRAAVTAAFLHHSACFAAYRRKLLEKTQAAGWPRAEVERGLDLALHTDAAHDLLCDVMAVERTLRSSYAPDESLYVPQGVGG